MLEPDVTIKQELDTDVTEDLLQRLDRSRLGNKLHIESVLVAYERKTKISSASLYIAILRENKSDIFNFISRRGGGPG